MAKTNAPTNEQRENRCLMQCRYFPRTLGQLRLHGVTNGNLLDLLDAGYLELQAGGRYKTTAAGRNELEMRVLAAHFPVVAAARAAK